MLTRVVTTTGVLCLLFSGAGFAQGFSQGDKTLTLSGSGASDNEFSDNAFNFAGSLGYFLTDAVEAAVRQSVGFSNISRHDDNNWNASTIVALDYNFDAGRWWPFLGGNLGYIYGDAVNDTWAAGLEGGVRYFVNATTFVLGSIQYEFFFDSGSDISDAFDDGQFVYALGLGFKW
jgi:hypothetical protein